MTATDQLRAALRDLEAKARELEVTVLDPAAFAALLAGDVAP